LGNGVYQRCIHFHLAAWKSGWSRRPRRCPSSAMASTNAHDRKCIATSRDTTTTSHDIALSHCRIGLFGWPLFQHSLYGSLRICW
jgi:hypothetical protein